MKKIASGNLVAYIYDPAEAKKVFGHIFPILNDYYVISDILDLHLNKSNLGHLFIIFDHYVEITKTGFVTKPLTSSQLNKNMAGSYFFYGTNGNYFNHLFTNKFTGKFFDKINQDEPFTLTIDREYKMISSEFLNILKQYFTIFSTYVL